MKTDDFGKEENATLRNSGDQTARERGDAPRFPVPNSIVAGVRYALRQMGRSPAFTSIVVLTIALGIGANTAIFTLLHSILLQSLPVSDVKALYRIGDRPEANLTDGLQNDD